LVVGVAHPGGEPAQLALAQRRQLAAHGQAPAVRLGQPELHAALERAGEGAVAPRGGAQPESSGRLGEVELEPVGAGVEGGRQPAHQERRRRAEDPEPEVLDVG
jgi:hypothetical protein